MALTVIFFGDCQNRSMETDIPIEVLFFGLPEFEREDDGKNAEV